MALSVITTNDAQTLVDEILAPGVFGFNLSYTGGASSSGTFTGGLSAGLAFDSGIILTSGLASDAVGPNGNGAEAEVSGVGNAVPEVNNGASTDLGLAGDADLTALAGFTTQDATVLEFDFTSAGGDGQFTYVFASEEYIDYENSPFNDVFAFFLDGNNIALLPDNSPVEINTVNSVSNTSLFNQNISPATFDIEYDGFTVALTANLNNLTPGVHNIKLAIADASDGILDSAVFIQAGSFDLNPLEISLDPVTINENESVATLTGQILGTIPLNGGTFDYNLAIDFGDPNNPDVRNFVLQDGGMGDTDNVDGTITFELTLDPPHQYLDDQALADGPSPGNGTAFDLFATATVTDPNNQVASDESFITVNNVVPVVELDPPPMIDENETLAIAAMFTDPGLLDEHWVTVNWDDPNDSTDSQFQLPATQDLSEGDTFNSADGAVLVIDAIDLDIGKVTFSVNGHQYLDDGLFDPAGILPENGTSSDPSTITVTVSDDDGYSFESGDFAAWETIGATGVVSGAVGATDGTYFAQMIASGVTTSQIEVFLDVTPGSIAAITDGNPTDGAAIKLDDLMLYEGQTISFDWYFDAADYLPYDDNSFFTTLNNTVQKLADVSDVGDFGDSGWQTESITIDANGVYDFGFGVVNEGDTAVDSALYVDNVKISGGDNGEALIKNVDPGIVSLTDNLAEHPDFGKILVEMDTLELEVTWSDQGTKDLHQVIFDWGEGVPTETPWLHPSVVSASADHQYNTQGTFTASATVSDDDLGDAIADVTFKVVKKIEVDWKPFSNPSAINLNNKGTTPVAIYGSEDFVVSDWDDAIVGTIYASGDKDELLEGGGVGVNVKKNGKLHYSIEDINSDGYDDAVLHFDTPELNTLGAITPDPITGEADIFMFGTTNDPNINCGIWFGVQQAGDPIIIV